MWRKGWLKIYTLNILYWLCNKVIKRYWNRVAKVCLFHFISFVRIEICDWTLHPPSAMGMLAIIESGCKTITTCHKFSILGELAYKPAWWDNSINALWIKSKNVHRPCWETWLEIFALYKCKLDILIYCICQQICYTKQGIQE